MVVAGAAVPPTVPESAENKLANRSIEAHCRTITGQGPTPQASVAERDACSRLQKKVSTMRSFDSSATPPILVTPLPRSVSSPDRDTLEKCLAQAEEYMAMSRGHIASQREFSARLLRDGHDASQALALLLRFEELEQLHVADRDRLRGELGR
jgi:hypothetical protein